MEWLYAIVRHLHIWAGFVSLLVFWVPLFAKKGGFVHRSSGWSFVITMVVLSATAFFLSASRISGWQSSTAEQLDFAWFLLLLAWLSICTAWEGLVVLRASWWRESPRIVLSITYMLMVVLVIGGVAMTIYGIFRANPVLQWFPIVAIIMALTLMRTLYNRTRQAPRVWRMSEHILGMIGCGITTITSFVVFAFPRLMNVDTAPLWMWVAPPVALSVVIFVAIRKYARA